jgi:O-antigen/teichoic acid export membrane protein
MGYFKDALRGVGWMTGLRGMTRLIAFVKIAVLARLLGPVEFGIFGIASLVLAFLEILSETGINAFLIQQKEDIKKYLNTAWTVSIIRGVLITFAIYIFSSPVSEFFGSPASKNLLRLISLVPLLRGFINPAIVRFQKELEFNKEFIIRIVVFTFNALVTIGLAFVIKNATSLAWGLIGAAILELFLSWIFIGPRPRISFEPEKIRKIVKKGKWITLSGIFSYIFRQGDDIVIGKLLSTYSLGLYQVAYKISTLPINEGGEVVLKVAFPVYTKIAGDGERLKKAYLKVLAISSLFFVLFGVILFLFSEPLVLFLLGSKWVEIIPVVKVLVFYGVVRAISGSSSALFLSVEKQKYTAFATFIGALGLVITIVPFVGKWGILGAGYSALFSWFLAVPFIMYFVNKVFKNDD